MAKHGTIFKGWGSVAVKDAEGELLPMDVLKQNIQPINEREIPITLHHSDTVVGRVLGYDFRYNDEIGAEGIWVKYEIYDDFPIDDQVKEGIESGELPELSIGGQYKLDEKGTATWIAPMTWAVCEKGISKGAKTIKKDVYGGDKMPEDKKPDEMKTPPEQKKEEIPAQKGEQVPPEKKEETPLEEKPDFDSMKKAQDELSNRLSRIEDMLDGLLEEEKKEQGTDAAITGAEQKPGDNDSAITFGKELFAQHEKKFAALEENQKRLEAQLAKYENTGIKRTVQSGGQSQKPNEMEGVMKEMGLI